MTADDSSPDDIRERILNAAGEMFAEKGFEKTTVREICGRVGANVAAVNYHFGDKLGLYTEVILERVRFAQEATRASSVDGSPEDQLRAFVHRYLTGLVGTGKAAWLTKLIATESSRPSPVLKRVVKEVVKPTEARVRKLVAMITGLREDSDEVRMCTHSVIGQCLHYRHAQPVLALLWRELWKAPDRIERLANHIVDFSLAGMRDVKRRKNG